MAETSPRSTRPTVWVLMLNSHPKRVYLDKWRAEEDLALADQPSESNYWELLVVGQFD
jgi:hypothetical protein